MTFYLADTHAIYWYLINSPLLGANASQAFDEADNGNAVIYIPAIALAELYYLNQKQGQPIDFAATFNRFNQSPQFVLLPFEPEEVLDFDTDQLVPEMHDRIIAGTARRLNIPCLTRDNLIINSGIIKIVW